MDSHVKGNGSSAQRPPSAIHTWLDALREELGATLWSVALREGESWDIVSPEPSLRDGIFAQILAEKRYSQADRATLVDVSELGDIGARLLASGFERLLIVPGGPDARIILDAPDIGRAKGFAASSSGLGTTFDLAGAIRAEKLAADLISIAEWWPDEVPAPQTLTLEGTLLAGRIAASSGSARDDAEESRRNALLLERARIASVIHDGVTQVLTNVAVQLEVIRHVADDPERLRELVEMGRGAVLQALESLRGVIFDLTPSDEEWSDLAAGLQGFVADFTTNWGIDVNLHVEGERRDLDTEVVSLAFAFVQEALTNVRRHADADVAHVNLLFAPTSLEIEVRDEGVGVTGNASGDDLRQHQGLSIIKSRVRLLEGRLDLESAPGAGTTVRIEMPA